MHTEFSLLSALSSLKSFLRIIYKRVVRSPWSGDYSSWEEAKAKCTGYESSVILEKVKAALLKVKNGEALNERDSVIIDKPEYSKNILNFLKEILSQDKFLSIVDFGGSLGSSYFLYWRLLNKSNTIRWSIVEQSHFVKEGRDHFEDDKLKFYPTIDEAISINRKRVLLLSSVIQYIKDPYELIKQIVNYDFDYIIIDRTAFIENSKEIITIQNVPESIYKASYPAWFFNEMKFLNSFNENYSVIDRFDSEIELPERVNKKNAYWKGFILKRRNA